MHFKIIEAIRKLAASLGRRKWVRRRKTWLYNCIKNYIQIFSLLCAIMKIANNTLSILHSMYGRSIQLNGLVPSLCH